MPCVIVDYTNTTYRAGVTSAGKLKVEASLDSTVGNLVIIRDAVNGAVQTSVNIHTTSAIGVNVLPLGLYKTVAPTLTDDQVYPLLVDSQGRLLISQSPTTRRVIELSYITSSLGVLVANMWFNVLWYTVPASYQLEITQFNCSAGNQLGSARANRARSLGTYNIGTSTFADGGAYVAPGFCSSVEAEVTTALTGTAVTLTVTYINESGVAGRTGTIVCLAAAPLKERFLMTLQAGDFGVRDITAISKSGGTAGVLTLYGLTTLFYEIIPTQGVTYPLLTARESVIIEAGDLISLEIVSSSVAAANRMVKVVGILSPV
jgi:hypothetical protein